MENACNSAENISKAKQAVHLLIQTNITHKKIIDQRTSSELHRSKHRMLMHISKHESISSQKEIAHDMGVSPAAVAVMLKRLESDGYIERTRGEDGDARQNSIKITAKGRQEIEATGEIFNFIDNTVFNNFTDEEMNSLIEMLGRVKANLCSIDSERHCETQDKTKGEKN